MKLIRFSSHTDQTFRIALFLPVFACCLLLFSQCRKPASRETKAFLQKVRFLEGPEAEKAILTDTTEAYFEGVSALDISLQLRLSPSDSIAVDSYRSVYKKRLGETLLPWDQTEVNHLRERLRAIAPYLRELSPELIPENLGLVKINGSFYGPNVFFTRESNIFLPAQSVKEAGPMEMDAILIHELVHIYTRTYPEIRKKLYAEIGFFPADCRIKVPCPVEERMLWNPDGLNDQFVMLLPEDSLFVSPRIISRSIPPEVPDEEYFRYIEFQLYPVRRDSVSGLCSLEHLPDGRSPLSLSDAPAFFEQITRNTDYYIHPDEVIAENIKLIVLSRKYPLFLDRLDENGKDLLQRIEGVVRE